MKPATARAWTRIVRDIATVAVGVGMLGHETLSDTPNAYVIGAGLAALGLPPALRLDFKRKPPDDEDD
jgi:hypothetical protein